MPRKSKTPCSYPGCPEVFEVRFCKEYDKENNKYRKNNWESCTAVPVMMPYITSQFMPRTFGDRSYVVPKGAVSFDFLGQYVEILDESARDSVFTTEYSARTAMEAVYVLCGVEKAVPEVSASRYDLRYPLNGMVAISDG